MMGCGVGNFGPGLNSLCRGSFDFALLFEDSILNLLPTACFLVLAPLRIWQLVRRRDKIKQSPVYYLKLFVAIILITTEIVSLGFVAASRGRLTRIALPAAVLDLVASVVLVFLVHFEHFRTIRPSLLSCSYLSIIVLFDIVRVRSAWLRFPETAWAASITASLVAKLLVLAIESIEKRRLLREPEKELSKESTAGPINRALFLWLNGLLKTGWKAVLRPHDLPPVDAALGVEQVFTRLNVSWLSVDQKRKYALLLAICKAFKREICAAVVPRLCLVGLSIAQPFMIGETVTYLQHNNSTSVNSNNSGYGLLGAFALVFIMTAVSTALYQHLGYRVMTMLRGSLIAALFHQMLSLPVEGVSESDAMALMGSDAEAFAEYFHTTITDTWADLLQLAVAIYLIARMTGAVVVAPVIVAIFFTWLSFRVGDMIAGRQRKWLQRTQKRVQFTTETVGRMRDAKMLGLTDYLSTTISTLRDEELDVSKAFRRVQTFKVCLVNIPMFLGQFSVFAAYGIAAHIRGTGNLSISETVTTLSLINLLLTPLRNLLYAIPDTFSALSCLQSIQEFLSRGKRAERRDLGQPYGESEPKGGTSDFELQQLNALKDVQTSALPASAVTMSNAVFGWNTPPIEDDLSAGTKGLTLTTPSVGKGSLTIITGPVGCGKSTILKAILGETDYLHGSVSMRSPEVAYCAQDAWIVNGSVRDNITGVPDNGFDQGWYSAVIQACALDLDFAHLPQGDKTVAGSRGIKFSGGQKQRIALARALYSRRRIVLLDDVFSGLDNTTRLSVFHNACGREGLFRRMDCTVIMTASQTDNEYLSEADNVIVLGKNGQVIVEGTYDDLKNSDAADFLDASEKRASHADGEGQCVDRDTTSDDLTQEKENESLHTPDLALWKFYFDAMGWAKIALLCIFLCAEGGFGAFRYVWLTWWAASEDATSGSRLGYWIGIYASYGVLETAGLALGTFWTWVIIVPAASRKLHSVVLAATMAAPASFLSNTETGLLINRFSQDMRLVDMVLPRGFISTGFQLFGTVAQAAVAIAALPYLAPAIPFVVVVLVLIQRFYLRTSRQLRLLDLELKAPVYTHFIESLQGLVTIRAFGWNKQYLLKTFDLLDTAQRPYYLLLSVQRWLTLVLNIVVAGLAILLVGLGVALRDRVKPELLGVALVMMTGLGQIIADLIQAWTLLEISLGAVSRIKSFAESTPRETDGLESLVPDKEWPSAGAIEFRSVSATHDDTGGLVLRDINLSIFPGQKVGVCGRTGSGKSSLLMSLLRMVRVTSGRILIDGEDIANISPPLLRTRLNCLVQEPLILPDTIRRNADPLLQSSDADIVSALEAVGLWDAITAKVKEDNPLEAIMDDKLLSHGQRQLFALARAMLRKSGVLLFDEPTSSLDNDTHERVQSIIRSSFRDSIIIMVAHRLGSLLDFDRIAVLGQGRLLEYGEPRGLLADERSAFSKLFRSGRTGLD